MVASGQVHELEACLGKRIGFGTAGHRGLMLPEFAKFNSLTVIQTSQGIASYAARSNLLSVFSGGVIIGSDGRHNSENIYAGLAGNAFRKMGVKVLRSKVRLRDSVLSPLAARR